MEMMENPIGFTTFPQPPPTPLFPSDFLPVQEKKLRDIFEGLKARRGTYIINRVLPYFSTSQISAYFHPAPDLTTRHILSIEFFPIFSCYYSLSGRLLQVPRTGLFFTRSYRPRYGRAPFPVPAPADPCRALPPPACSPASAASQGEGAAAPANAFPESPGHRSDPPPASQ